MWKEIVCERESVYECVATVERERQQTMREHVGRRSQEDRCWVRVVNLWLFTATLTLRTAAKHTQYSTHTVHTRAARAT